MLLTRRHSRPAAVLAALVLTCGALPLLTACGSAGLQAGSADEGDNTVAALDPSLTDTASPEPLVEDSATAEATTPASASVTGLDYTDSGYVWQYSNELGYSYDMEIAVGAPLNDVSSLTADDDLTQVGSVCASDYDPTTDVIIPVRWTATATTSGYDTTIAMRMQIELAPSEYTGSAVAPQTGDERIEAERYFSSGNSCEAMSSTGNGGLYGTDISVEWSEPLSEGQTVTDYFDLIVKDYYTPAAPDGDAAFLDAVAMRPSVGGDRSDLQSEYNGDGRGIWAGDSLHGVTLAGGLVQWS